MKFHPVKTYLGIFLLAGTGKGFDLGIAFGQFKITPAQLSKRAE